MMCCPFHADSTPSMKIYHDHFHCYGCGAHGGHIDWLMAVEGLSRAEATHLIENWDGPITPRQPSMSDDVIKRASACACGKRLARSPARSRLAISLIFAASTRRPTRQHRRRAALSSALPVRLGLQHPCLIALMRNAVTDAPTGIHRIALTPKPARSSAGRLATAAW